MTSSRPGPQPTDTDRLREAVEAVGRVRVLADSWAALAPDDDWGEDIASTIQADLGRAVLRALAVPVPASPTPTEEADR